MRRAAAAECVAPSPWADGKDVTSGLTANSKARLTAASCIATWLSSSSSGDGAKDDGDMADDEDDDVASENDDRAAENGDGADRPDDDGGEVVAALEPTTHAS